MLFIQAWRSLAIFFISLLSLLYPQQVSSQPQVAAADAAPLKHALFLLFDRALEVPQYTRITHHAACIMRLSLHIIPRPSSAAHIPRQLSQTDVLQLYGSASLASHTLMRALAGEHVTCCISSTI